MGHISVGYQHLAYGNILPIAAGVLGIDGLYIIGRENLPHAWGIVQTQDEPAFDACKLRGQRREVFFAEDPFAIIVLAVPIRRVDVEQCPRRVIAGYHFRIRQTAGAIPALSYMTMPLALSTVCISAY